MKREIIQMEIVKAPPPNFAAIRKIFPGAAGFGILFAYGDTIFNPSGVPVPAHLAAHEHVHQKQQRGYGVEKWWEHYLISPQFRLEQEIPAHQVEYEQWCIDNPTSRPTRRVGLKGMAQRLSGPLYNNMVSFPKAKALIKIGAPPDV